MISAYSDSNINSPFEIVKNVNILQSKAKICLREGLIFGDSSSSKIAIFAIYEAMNYDFG